MKDALFFAFFICRLTLCKETLFFWILNLSRKYDLFHFFTLLSYSKGW